MADTRSPGLTEVERARQRVATEVEGDSDSPLRVAEANAILAGERDDQYPDIIAALSSKNELPSASSLTRDDVVEKLKVAFWASLTNANAGMRWLDYDSMEEMISAAWVGFEQPAIEALSQPLTDGAGKRGLKIEPAPPVVLEDKHGIYATPSPASVGVELPDEIELRARALSEAAFTTFKKADGSTGSIEGDDGEMCFIVPHDEMIELRATLQVTAQDNKGREL